MSAEELGKLVGPIALYPDDLVGIILPASTNPLQLVQADRFLEKRKTDPKLPVDDRWDDPVKSLLNYPDVVKMMSGDLDWTSALGEAVVADQGAVIEAVQAFRRKATGRGKPQIRRQAGREGRAGDRIHRAGRSAGNLRSAVQPHDGRRRKPDACLCLLPDALPIVLLPVSAWRSARHRHHLGCGDRRSLERQPLRLLWGRQHQRQPEHEYQHRQRQSAPARDSQPAAPRGNPTSSPVRSAGSIRQDRVVCACRVTDRRGVRAPGEHRRKWRVRAVRRASPRVAGSRGGPRWRVGDALGSYGSGRQAQMDSSRGASSRSSMVGPTASRAAEPRVRCRVAGGRVAVAAVGAAAVVGRARRRRRPALNPGALSCAHSLSLKARYRP